MDIRLGLSLLAVGFTVYAGAWVRAEFVLTDRVRQVALGAQQACAGGGRGTSASQSPESIGQRLVALAAEHEIEASEVSVQMRPLLPGHASGFAGAFADQLAATTGGKVKIDMTQVTFGARLRGEKWLWSVDKPLEASCLLHGKVERLLPEVPTE